MQTKSFPVIPTLSHPFPWKENPYLHEVEKLVPQWIDQYDFLSENQRKKLKKSKLDLFSALYWPGASKEVFFSMTRWSVWLTVYDDYYGPYLINELQVANDCFLEILKEGALISQSNENFRQMALIRDELVACSASQEWMEHFIDGHRLFFEGTIEERFYSYNDSVHYPSMEQYEDIRRKVVARYSFSNITQLGAGFILPADVAAHPLIKRLEDLGRVIN